MNVAQRVATTLAELGIRRVYGLPGEDHMTLLHALVEAGIEYHTAVNESSSVIMAAADSKVGGLPGVAILSLAPGVSNGVNGILNAFMEQLPVLIISGQHAGAREPFVVRQGFDIRSLIDPVTKWAGRLGAKADPVLAVCKALDVATANRPGPVYLELSDEIAKAEEPEITDVHSPCEVLRASWADRGLTRVRGPVATSSSMATLRSRLAAAKHPVLVVGGRANELSVSTVEDFARTFSCPVFTSSGQKGLLTSANPNYAGTFLNGAMETQILAQSDLILMVNPEAYDIYNTPWRYDDVAASLTSVASDEWLYPFSLRVVADPDSALRTLAESVDSASVWTASEIAGYRGMVKETLLGSWNTEFSVAEAVQGALAASPSSTRLVADAGFSKPILAMLSEPEDRDHYLASNALSTMGYSIPAAIGAVRASGAPALSFLGDGSLLMRVSELALAQELPASLVVVAIMDESLSQIEIKQERLKLRNVGVTLPPFSCKAIGEAFGVNGIDVSDRESLEAAVAGAWSSRKPTLIGAHVQTTSSRRIYESLRG